MILPSEPVFDGDSHMTRRSPLARGRGAVGLGFASTSGRCGMPAEPKLSKMSLSRRSFNPADENGSGGSATPMPGNRPARRSGPT